MTDSDLQLLTETERGQTRLTFTQSNRLLFQFTSRASCIMPWTEAEGWVDFEVSLKGGPFYWKGRFFVGKSRSFAYFCYLLRTGVFNLWNALP